MPTETTAKRSKVVAALAIAAKPVISYIRPSIRSFDLPSIKRSWQFADSLRRHHSEQIDTSWPIPNGNIPEIAAAEIRAYASVMVERKAISAEVFSVLETITPDEAVWLQDWQSREIAKRGKFYRVMSAVSFFVALYCLSCVSRIGPAIMSATCFLLISTYYGVSAVAESRRNAVRRYPF